MKLCESPDFREVITAAANHFSNQGLTEQFIEKDYYITEALRIIAGLYPDRVVFKGGTTLSKGWHQINRFSEDIDLFFNPDVSVAKWGQSKIDKALKIIETKVGEHPNLQFSRVGSSKGISRDSKYTYNQEFVNVGSISNNILLEMGTRSGDFPTELVHLSSFLADFLRKIDKTLDTGDESPFPMMLLHFRRTFVEKLFAIHNNIEVYQRNKVPFDRYTRHYYDLYQLGQQDEVKKLLRSEDFIKIKQDCDLVSQKHFSNSYFPPKNLNFANSLALFPAKSLYKEIKKAYTEQCKSLCYGSYPSWDAVAEYFLSIREQL